MQWAKNEDECINVNFSSDASLSSPGKQEGESLHIFDWTYSGKKNERILLKIACTKFFMLSEYKENFIIVSDQNIIDKSF